MKYEKISPSLLAALEDYKDNQREGLLPHMGALGLVAPANSPKPPRTVVFISCDEKDDLGHLTRKGIIVNQVEGRVRTAFLPVDRLEDLSDEPKVKQITASTRLRPLLDVAADEIRLPAFKLSNPLTGKGVIVGIIDSGIDTQHLAFKGRILRVWDQDHQGGPGVKEGHYGLEYQGALLPAARDFNGHGTHVAGIAAGSDATFQGIAPDADLLVVKTDFSSGHIADAVRYIFRVAGELGRPAVVNLSLGGHSDPHDGTDPLSIVIDDESGPGRIVCCAAGNEGNDDIHAQVNLSQGDKTAIRFHVPQPPPPGNGSGITVALLNGWYPGADEIEVAVQTPSGFLTPFQPVISKGNPEKTHSLPNAKVRIYTPGPDPENGDHNFLIRIDRSNTFGFSTDIPTGIWKLHLRGTKITQGKVDIWALDNSGELDVTFRDSVQDSVKVGSPGAAAEAVTVAASQSKLSWTDIDGNVRQINGTQGDIADFSSEGPLRNGNQKPDITAPGAWVASMLSRDANFNRFLMLDNEHVMLQGTSMAAPVITGLIALLLERNKSLDPAALKSLLRSNCSIPNKSAGSFDQKWGFGLIDTTNL